MAIKENFITLCFPNRIDEATLSGGSYTTDRPLSNIQDRALQVKARTSDATTGSTKFTVTLPQRRTTGCIAIAAHNMSVDATVEITVYDGTAATIYESGTLQVWPSILGPNQLEWEDDNFWLGTPTDEQRAEFTPLFVHFFGPEVTTEEFDVEITDTSNSDGYVEFGRVFCADVLQTEVNAQHDGFQWGHEDATTVQQTAAATTEYFDTKPVRRTLTFSMPVLSLSEAFDDFARMQKTMGISGEVLVTDQTTVTAQYLRRTMLARQVELDPLTTPYHDNWQSGASLREIL